MQDPRETSIETVTKFSLFCKPLASYHLGNEFFVGLADKGEKSTLKIFAKLIFELFRLIFKSRNDIILENLALRQQLAETVFDIAAVQKVFGSTDCL